MTADDLISRLNVEDAEAHLTPNGGAWWIAVTRYNNGQRYSHSARLPLNPSDTDIQDTREVFNIWWAETTRDQR